MTSTKMTSTKMTNIEGNDQDISKSPVIISLLDDEVIFYEILNRLPVKLLLRLKCVCKRWRSLIENDRVIFYEILSRLPVKSLMRFKCVCKRWQFFIENDQHFIDLHFNLSKRRPGILLAFCIDNVYRFVLANLFEGKAVAQTIMNPGIDHSTMLKPVNGLICFQNVNRASVCIYNLGMRQVTPWIKPTRMKEFEKNKQEEGVRISRTLTAFLFGFDPATKEHKVICVWNMVNKVVSSVDGLSLLTNYKFCEVLTVGKSSWRRIDEVPRFTPTYGTSICVNGSIYWINYSSLQTLPLPDVIAVFDLGTEKFRMIQVPTFILDQPQDILYGDYSGQRADLFEVDGRVALLYRMSTTIAKMWIFDDDKGESSSSSSNNNWIEETILLPSGHGEGNRRYSFQAIAGTDQIIVTCNTSTSFTIYLYDRKKMITKEVEISGFAPIPRTCSLVSMFVESLVHVQ